MAFSIRCPECGERQTVPDEVAGKKLRCKKCEAVFRATRPDAAGSKRPARSDDEEEPPRRRRDEDEEPRTRRADEDESPRSRRRRDDNDDEVEERPRRKAASKGGRKDGGRKGKKPVTVVYVLGLLGAIVFLGGAIGFLGWRAGVFGTRENVKEKTVTNEKEPEYVAPDVRIGATRKETTGPDGERAASVQRVKLSMDVKPLADGASEVVVHYEVLIGPELPRNNRLVVVETDRMYALEVDPTPNDEDRRKGTFTIQLSPETRQKYKKFWIASMPGNEEDVKKHGLRVSNVVMLP